MGEKGKGAAQLPRLAAGCPTGWLAPGVEGTLTLSMRDQFGRDSSEHSGTGLQRRALPAAAQRQRQRQGSGSWAIARYRLLQRFLIFTMRS